MDNLSINWIYEEMGRRIRDARKRTQRNQDEIAEILNISRASVVNIENGKQRPPLHVIYNIAEILGVSPHELLPPTISATETEAIGMLPTNLEETIDQSAEGDEAVARNLRKFITRIIPPSEQQTEN